MRPRPASSFRKKSFTHRLWDCLLPALLILGSGCGQEPAAGKVTFAVGGAPSEIAFWQEVVSEFERQSGIAVELLRQPTDTGHRRQNLVVALKAGKSDPDVFLMDVVWLAQFAASDWLQPLDGYLDGQGPSEEDFIPRVIDLVDRFGGRLLALPVYVDGGLLYYRTDLLERFGFSGPPRTWDQLLSMGLAVQQALRPQLPGFYAFVWQGAQYEGLICNFMEFAGEESGFVIKSGFPSVDMPANRRALSFMRDLIHRHGISPPNTYTEMREEEVRTAFQEGRALFERNWPYAWPLHQAENSPVKGKVGIAPMPGFDPAGSVSTLGGWHIGISKMSDAKAEAWKLVAFLTSFDIQKAFALKLGWNPGRTDVYTDPEVLKIAPHLEKLAEVFENAEPRPLVPYYAQVSDILQRQLNDALADRIDPARALSAAESQMRAVARRYTP